MNFTGYQGQHYNPDTLNQDAVRCWSIVVSDGHLWINPEGVWLAEYDWPAIRDALSKMVSKNEGVYQTWDRVAEMFGFGKNDLFPEMEAV